MARKFSLYVGNHAHLGVVREFSFSLPRPEGGWGTFVQCLPLTGKTLSAALRSGRVEFIYDKGAVPCRNWGTYPQELLSALQGVRQQDRQFCERKLAELLDGALSPEDKEFSRRAFARWMNE